MGEGDARRKMREGGSRLKEGDVGGLREGKEGRGYEGKVILEREIKGMREGRLEKGVGEEDEGMKTKKEDDERKIREGG